MVRSTFKDALFRVLLTSNFGGQLTTDGEYVFAVEETSQETMQLDLDRYPASDLRPNNYLRAYEARTGRLRGQAGGSVGSSGGGGQVNPLTGMYFLGSPLVMGDRIYVMAESDQGIFLLQLKATSRRSFNGEVDMMPVRSQLLSLPMFPVTDHPVRKQAGLIPSFGGGLLICCACDEQIVAVSAEDHSIRWVYRYAGNVGLPEIGNGLPVIAHAFQNQESQNIDLAYRWVDSLPVIVEDRVLVTPRDSDRLICLELASGRELWSHPRGVMRMIAATGSDYVVLAGNHSLERLELATGKLQWSAELSGGHVTGRPVTNGRVIQLPTSHSTIVTFDVRNGRRLLELNLPTNVVPGNLISSGEQLFSQSVSQVTGLSSVESPGDSTLQNVRRILLTGDVSSAEELLRKEAKRLIQQAPGENTSALDAEDEALRRLTIQTLMESLKLDYPSTAPHIPLIRSLIEQTRTPQEDVLDVVQHMIGMTPVDTVLLPAKWDAASRSQRQLDILRSLQTRGELDSGKGSPEDLAKYFLQVLSQAADETDEVITESTVTCRSDRLAVANLLSALKKRSPEEQQQILAAMEEGLADRIRNTESALGKIWWANVCLLMGCPDVARRSFSTGDHGLTPGGQFLLADLCMLREIELATAESARPVVMELLDRWDQPEYSRLGETLLANSRRQSVNNDLAPEMRPAVTRDFALPPGILDKEQLQGQQVRFAPLERPWQGEPKVDVSPDRTVQFVASRLAESPDRVIPLFETTGVFSGWTFTSATNSTAISAYDANGEFRWTFDPGRMFFHRRGAPGRSENPLFNTYLVAYGSLLALKHESALTLMNAAAADPNRAPEVLWTKDLSRLLPPPSQAQSYIQAWQRTTQYDMQTNGLFPVGTMTRFGIPVYSDRTLSLLDLFTGTTQWQVSDLPNDCTLTTVDDQLILISQSDGQVQVRSLLNGELDRTLQLPEWWISATENSNASIRDFELEPGEDQYWRLLVENGCCLLLRRNTSESELQWFRLSENRTVHSIKLPADAVVSNAAYGRIAVLCDGSQLRLIDVLTGQTERQLEVPAAPESRFLYLRYSGGHWVVLTDLFDRESEDVNPISSSVVVNGPIYSINAESGELAWTDEADHEWLRILRPASAPRPVPPQAPFLLLMKRPWVRPEPGGPPTGAKYQARVLDVRTGSTLFADEDLGRDLSFHYVHFSPSSRKIELSFERRVITFDYSAQGSDGQPSAEEKEGRDDSK
ncbi:MAG: PQQ-binding-like beta-propeller repeat protein [Planctomycetaceae bacterium]|nr:PQQ-binding-like beta-propeller repeat protein [Planctomycetaceae bacterium]